MQKRGGWKIVGAVAMAVCVSAGAAAFQFDGSRSKPSDARSAAAAPSHGTPETSVRQVMITVQTESVPSWVKKAERLKVRDKNREKLMDLVSVDLNQMPLSKVLESLEPKVGIAFYLERIELENIGVDPDSPVTIRVRDVTLEELLDRILSPLDLAFDADAVGIRVTSHDDLLSEPSLRFYDLSEMSNKPIEWKSFMSVLTSMVDPEEWLDFGGTGESRVSNIGTSLVVSAPVTTHRKIESFLAECSRMGPERFGSEFASWSSQPSKLRDDVKLPKQSAVEGAIAAQTDSTNAFESNVGSAEHSKNVLAQLGGALPTTAEQSQPQQPASTSGMLAAPAQAQPLPAPPVVTWVKADPSEAKPSSNEMFTLADSRHQKIEEMRKGLYKEASVDFDKVPLRQACTYIAQQLNVEIYLNEIELDNVGVDPESPVSLNAKGMSLSQLFDRMLSPLELTYQVGETGFEVTSVDDAGNSPVLRAYDLSQIFDDSSNLLAVMSAISMHVAPDEWQDFGGSGCSRMSPIGSTLFVSAQDSVHLQIDAFLSQMHGIPKVNLKTDVSSIQRFYLNAGGGAFGGLGGQQQGGMF